MSLALESHTAGNAHTLPCKGFWWDLAYWNGIDLTFANPPKSNGVCTNGASWHHIQSLRVCVCYCRHPMYTLYALPRHFLPMDLAFSWLVGKLMTSPSLSHSWFAHVSRVTLRRKLSKHAIDYMQFIIDLRRRLERERPP